MESKESIQTGDIFLDRYMPHASVEEREAARENLRVFAAVVLRVATRLAKQEYEQSIRVSGGRGVDSESGSPPFS